MKNAPANVKPRARSRKNTEPTAPSAAPDAPSAEVSGPPKNVNALESAFSLVLGILFVVGALFPRSIKQLVLLGLGGGLVYRGMTSHCGLYQAFGLDSEKGSLLNQINDKYLAGSQGRNG